jgi:hypothetical protein
LQEILAQGCAVVAQLARGMAQQRLQQGLRLDLFGIAEGGFQAIRGAWGRVPQMLALL